MLMNRSIFGRRKASLASLILVLILTIITSLISKENPASVLSVSQPGLYRVTEVFDGDTISVDMNGKREKIRMIGVDTPETHDPRKAVQCFGQRASEFTTKLLLGKEIRLEADPTNQNRDRYDRLLRYVYLPDGTLVNAAIISRGYGFAYTSFPFQKIDEFKELQRDAQEQNLGLWSDCTPTANEFGGYTSNDAN